MLFFIWNDYGIDKYFDDTGQYWPDDDPEKASRGSSDVSRMPVHVTVFDGHRSRGARVSTCPLSNIFCCEITTEACCIVQRCASLESVALKLAARNVVTNN